METKDHSMEAIRASALFAAEVLGNIAHKDGKTCVPALDQDFMKLLGEFSAGKPIGYGTPLLVAWTRGWTLAHDVQNREAQRTSPKGFPVFTDHAAAKCFSCDGEFVGEPKISGYPPGAGKFVKSCRCGYRTWYDVTVSS